VCNMIDLKAKREANKARLLGLNPESKKAPYTKADCIEPEVCWEIISIVVRKGEKQNTLAYPELFEVVTVGEKKAVKTAKKDVIVRTNIKTMQEMFKIRNSMNKHAIDDVNDDYIEYFKSVVEVLDTYATTVVADMIDAKPSFLDDVNAIRCK
jgi:GTP:adenosylcobinamide-phosphate guanylyltransferase